MKTIIALSTAVAVMSGVSTAVQASPEEDLKVFQGYFAKKFTQVTDPAEFANGVYSIDPVSRETWEAIEEFPPYEPMIEEGETMWNTPFANGKGYADCFADGPAQRKNFPHWDKDRKMVVTLPLALNECREANGEKALKYSKGAIASLLAYMAYESRDQVTEVSIPDADAEAAYAAGKQFYYAKRGQLNFSCANCHVQNAGMALRTDILSP
ncbi:MAG: sulfur oxidation c-type cytochrome SoxA, partial [Gammaproteobacteria bacterium]